MMQIKIARHSGFCFGVRRAIDIVNSVLKEKKDKEIVYSLGPIIHNPQVVECLRKKGIRPVEDIKDIKKGTVIISSHGTSPQIIQYLETKDISIIDATCPFVKYAQDIVRMLKRDGYRIIIIGDKSHPEVRGLSAIAGSQAFSDKVGVISQTTHNRETYIKEIINLLSSDFKELRIFDTICRDAIKRQASTKELLKKCDFMIVIGGRNSANTKRLWQICKDSGVDSIHIETDKELYKRYLKDRKCVGIVSGASTPYEMVKRVSEKIRSFHI